MEVVEKHHILWSVRDKHNFLRCFFEKLENFGNQFFVVFSAIFCLWWVCRDYGACWGNGQNFKCWIHSNIQRRQQQHNTCSNYSQRVKSRARRKRKWKRKTVDFNLSFQFKDWVEIGLFLSFLFTRSLLFSRMLCIKGKMTRKKYESRFFYESWKRCFVDFEK